MKYVLYVVLVDITLLAGLFLFAAWWTALIYASLMIVLGMYVARYYDRHHMNQRFFGSTDDERQRRVLDAYVGARKAEILSAKAQHVLDVLSRGRAIGHLECLGCGQMVSKLLPTSGKDLRMPDGEHFMRLCPSCLEWIRAAYRLESPYSQKKAVRDLALAIPIISVVLILISFSLPVLNATFAGTRIALISIGTFFTGVSITWDKIKARYIFNPNLLWAMKSRAVIVGFSIIAGSLVATAVYFA